MLLRRLLQSVALPTAVASLLVACSPQRVSGVTLDAPRTASTARHGEQVQFEGTCDASGAVPLDERRFAVADDEDNLLRIYDADVGGPPLAAIDLSPALSLSGGAEADLEAAAHIGDRAYFLGSHGRTRRGEPDPNRFAFFSLQVTGTAATLAGTPYRRLLHDLSSAPALQPYDLHTAITRGELSFEGMTATPAATLWLGLRSPVPEGQALVLELGNPREVMDGAAPRLESLHTLDLGGLGVRGLSFWRGSYLVIAGPAGDGGPFALYRWQGSGAPQLIERELLHGLGPEGFFSHEERDEVLILSDDGTRLVDGTACKHLPTAERKGFRGVWLSPQRS